MIDLSSTSSPIFRAFYSSPISSSTKCKNKLEIGGKALVIEKAICFFFFI